MVTLVFYDKYICGHIHRLYQESLELDRLKQKQREEERRRQEEEAERIRQEEGENE
jgi:hypothetical protein